MEIKVNISAEDLDSNTCTSVRTDSIIVLGKPFTYTGNPICTTFYSRLHALAKDKNNVELKYTTSASGEYIAWVSVYSNTQTSDIFSIFKAIGIYMPKLTIGLNETAKKVYASTKLCKDLNKFLEPQRAAILMYILSIAHYIIVSERNLIKYKYDAVSVAVNVDVDSAKTFESCFRAFTEDTWYLTDNVPDNYTSVKYIVSDNVGIVDNFANANSVKVGLVERATDKSQFGVASVKMGELRYTYVVGASKACTDIDLCNIEIATDSITTFIANAINAPFEIVERNPLPFTSDMSFIEFEGDTLTDGVDSGTFNKNIAAWLLRMITKGAVVADIEDFEYISKTYGVKMPSSGAHKAPSYDEMCESYKDDDYAQELYKQVKPYYSTYVLGDDLNANLKGFANGAIYSMAFVGASGTGKSTAARVIPARCGIPYISINFSVNIEEADLFGSMVPNSKKACPEDPEFVWADGIITKAVRNGYCVILEELNFARPGVLGKLNSLLDENRQVDLSTGEIVRAHPNFRIIATCNIAYEGTNRFNKALINRFDDVTVFEDLPRNEAINIIKSRTGYTNGMKLAKVYDVYEALKKFSEEQNINAVVSMRQLLNIFTKGKYYSSAKDAVKRIMVNGAFIEDPEYQKVFEETVLTAFDLKFKI